ncbi:MAG: type III polyketide synthase, partial [Planctomycetota bacterium]
LDLRQKILAALYRRSGIDRRGSVLIDDDRLDVQDGGYSQFFHPDPGGPAVNPTTSQRMRRYGAEAETMALAAARSAMRNADATAAQFTHLITVTCTGFEAPGFDLALIDQLNLPDTIQRTQVGFMGCHGMMNALRVADAFVHRAQPSEPATVLVVSVELCTLHFQFSDQADDIISGAIFADGGSAAVVGRHLTNDASDACPPTDQSRCPNRLIASGSTVVPDTADAMTWNIGDHGFRMTLSTTVPALIQQHLRPFLVEWLNRQNMRLEDIAGWAVHPGGPRILNAVEAALSLSPDALASSRYVLQHHGNMSSATMLFVIKEMHRRSIPGPYLMLGFGPGLTIEVALMA